MWWMNEKLVEVYWQERLGQAEYERFILKVCAKPARRERFFCKFLLWLGRRMIAWGGWLQERYSEVTEDTSGPSTAKEFSS